VTLELDQAPGYTLEEEKEELKTLEEWDAVEEAEEAAAK
jgi:hypothetical protein